MIISSELVRSLLPERDREANKGNYGNVLITGGCVGMTGAVVLCAASALRTGSGLVTAAVPASLNAIYETKLTEAMTLPLADCGGIFTKQAAGVALEYMSGCSAAAIGPGMGTAGETPDCFGELIKNSSIKTVIDADGLNILAKNPHLLPYIKGRAVLTPHPGEMSRLTGLSISDINKNREAIAAEYAKKTGTVVVLKGRNTVVTDGDAVFVCSKGNPGMATGGSGDCLTGIILSLAGQGRSLIHAAAGGVYIHALAGDLAASEVGEYSLIASDIIKYIPAAIQVCQKGVK